MLDGLVNPRSHVSHAKSDQIFHFLGVFLVRQNGDGGGKRIEDRIRSVRRTGQVSYAVAVGEGSAFCALPSVLEISPSLLASRSGSAGLPASVITAGTRLNIQKPSSMPIIEACSAHAMMIHSALNTSQPAGSRSRAAETAAAAGRRGRPGRMGLHQVARAGLERHDLRQPVCLIIYINRVLVWRVPLIS